MGKPKRKTRIYLPTLTRAIISKETAVKENLAVYTVQEYADKCFVSTDTVHYRIRDHQVQAFKYAGFWYVVEKLT